MATFTNRAFLTYRNSVTPSNVVTGEIREVLSAAKTAVIETYGAGDTVTYVISLVNAGGTAVTDLTVTDDLGAYPFGSGTVVPLEYIDGSVRYFVNGVLQAAPIVTAVSPLTITGISIPAGGNAVIVYETAVNEYAPLDTGSVITNTAVITGNGTPITVTETVTVTDAAMLSITKSLEPVPVVDNEFLTYTFLLQNYGNTATVATDNVAVTDIFDPILTDITVTLNGVTLTEGVDYTYDETTGAFATIPGQVSIPAATYTQDPITGQWITDPGAATLTVNGHV